MNKYVKENKKASNGKLKMFDDFAIFEDVVDASIFEEVEVIVGVAVEVSIRFK